MAELEFTSVQYNGRKGTVTGTFRISGEDALQAAAGLTSVRIELTDGWLRFVRPQSQEGGGDHA